MRLHTYCTQLQERVKVNWVIMQFISRRKYADFLQDYPGFSLFEIKQEPPENNNALLIIVKLMIGQKDRGPH